MVRDLVVAHQRNAGTSALAPCSSPAWLAGVVAGSSACHSVRMWRPDRIQRLDVGRLPAWTAQRTSGAERPSIWIMTTPGASVRAADRPAPRVLRRRYVMTAPLSPAVTNHQAMLTTIAEIHDAQNASHSPRT